MKKILILVLLLAPLFALGQGAGQVWIPTNRYLKVFDSNFGLMAPGLATSTTGCLGVDAQGWISASGSACGSGSGTGDWKVLTINAQKYLTPTTTDYNLLLQGTNGLISHGSSTFSNALNVNGVSSFTGVVNASSTVHISGNTGHSGHLIFAPGDTYDIGSAGSNNRLRAIYTGTVSSGSGATGLTLRTQAASPILFHINSAEQARISTAGFLGINTTTPARLLSVDGDAIITGSLKTGPFISTSTLTVLGAATSTFTGGIYADALQTNLLSCDSLDTDASGAIICGSDGGTTYTAGKNLDLTGTEFKVQDSLTSIGDIFATTTGASVYASSTLQASGSIIGYANIYGQSLNASTTLHADGYVRFGGSLRAVGSSTFSGQLNASGALNASSTLHITGASTLNGLTLNGNLIFAGDTIDELVGDGLDLSSGDLIFDCSDVVSTGLQCSGEDLQLNATGDWTGTIDGNNFAGGAIGAGELIYGGSAGSFSELAAGTKGTILSMTTGAIPGWVSTSSLVWENDSATSTLLGGIVTTGLTSSNGIFLSSGIIRSDDVGSSTFSGGATFARGVGIGLTSCDSVDTDTLGYLICGVDASGASTFDWTHTAGENINATSSILLFNNGFISSASSSIAGHLFASRSLFTTGLITASSTSLVGKWLAPTSGVPVNAPSVLSVIGANGQSDTSGAGGATGGPIVLTGGVGGSATTTTTSQGGVGGGITLTSGRGGVNTDSSNSGAAVGGQGGFLTISGGRGGNSTGTSNTAGNTGGTGGALDFYSGDGGDASGSASNTGGAAGSISFNAGLGGSGSTAPGTDGNIVFNTAGIQRMLMQINGQIIVGSDPSGPGSSYTLAVDNAGDPIANAFIEGALGLGTGTSTSNDFRVANTLLHFSNAKTAFGSSTMPGEDFVIDSPRTNATTTIHLAANKSVTNGTCIQMYNSDGNPFRLFISSGGVLGAAGTVVSQAGVCE